MALGHDNLAGAQNWVTLVMFQLENKRSTELVISGNAQMAFFQLMELMRDWLSKAKYVAIIHAQGYVYGRA